MKLYHYWRSSCSWRVRWALQLKQLQCEYISVGLLDGEVEGDAHRIRNPMGSVPVLEVDGHFLGQSLAIIYWLEQTYRAPAYPSLFLDGRPAWERAQMMQLAEIINADTQPLQNLTPQERHSSDPAEQKRWVQTWISAGLEGYERTAEHTAGVWSVGDQISIADLCLVPQVYNALRYSVSMEKLPICQRIYDMARLTTACIAASPEAYQPSK